MAKRRKKKQRIQIEDYAVAILIVISILLFVLIYMKSGYIGQNLSPILGGLVGFLKYILPFATFVIALCIAADDREYVSNKLINYVICLVCIATVMSIYQMSVGRLEYNNDFETIIKDSYELGINDIGGGVIGTMVAIPIVKLLGIVGAVILSVGSAAILIIYILGIRPAEIIGNMINSYKQRREEIAEEREKYNSEEKIIRENKKNKKKFDNMALEDQITINYLNDGKEERKRYNHGKDDIIVPSKIDSKKEQSSPDVLEANLFKKEQEQKEEKTKEVLVLEHAVTVEDEHYEFPPVQLLAQGKHGELKGGKKAVADTATKLQKTLYSFGVSAKVDKVSIGPAITRYEIRPAEGVRVNKIANLADDIALNLAAESIRIEAPIPGKQAVGIEVPNKENEVVHLRDIIESKSFVEHSSKLAFALGKDVAGNEVVTDIAKMPHVLIAGATGSGKSVCINTLVTSIIYKAKPSEVKLVMIDPKVVELSVYNGIPHLLIPVVTDPKKAAGALAWAVQEMVNRYSLFANKGVRDIKGYNNLLEKEEGGEKLPQIVIIIDELADLMMVAPNDVEDAICRLAQMARAAGMHLVIATQRPSVDVITGIIKANIPSRISFSVSSQVDSRTILDMVGAEKLLGKGDMLFYPTGTSKPVRVQGAFISDKDVEKVVDFIKANGEAKYSDDIIEI